MSDTGMSGKGLESDHKSNISRQIFEHSLFDVLPNHRNNHCLFNCFVEILRERNQAGRPNDYQLMRSAIADYIDQHGGSVAFGETIWPCDEGIRTNGICGTAEALAFATLFNISIELHFSDTNDVQEFYCGGPECVPELLLHTSCWEDYETSTLVDGGNWQRINKKVMAAGSEISAKFQANALLISANWRRCLSLELVVGNHGAQGDGFCPSLEHRQYEVIPIKRDGDCLFHCFWKILQERAPELLPSDIKSLRGIIADYFEQNDNILRNDEGVSFSCTNINAIRDGEDATGQNLNVGSLSEIFVFGKLYCISVSVYCPEATGAEAVVFDFGSPPELFLQTFGWEKEERRRGFDHWQRLQRRQNRESSIFSPSSVMPVLQKAIDARKTHRKLNNPRNFPLPRSDTVILRERVFLEENKKSIKDRLMQLSISTNNDVELAYTQLVNLSTCSNQFDFFLKLPGLVVSKGLGSPGSLAPTVSFTKNGRGAFKFCLRLDVPKNSAPAVKLVMCFQTAAERSRWHDAFLWAENRASIRKLHDGYVLAEQQAAFKLVMTANSLNSSSVILDEAAPNDAFLQTKICVEPIAKNADGRTEKIRRGAERDGSKSLHKSTDLTALIHEGRKTLHVSSTARSTISTIPIEVLETPCSQTVLDQMVSLVHSSLRRTLGHFSEAKGLLPVLEHVFCASVNAIWLSPSDFVSVSMFTRIRWIASVAQAVSFLHSCHVAHQPFDLDKSIAISTESNCKLLVVPQNDVQWYFNAEQDLQFIVSFAEKVIMAHPDSLSALTSVRLTVSGYTDGSSCDCCMRMLRNAVSDSGRMVGGIPVSSYNSEFDAVINEAFNCRSDSNVMAQSWIRICDEMSKGHLGLPSFHDVTSMLFWQEHLYQKALLFQTDDQSRYRRRATANDPNIYIFTSLQDDPNVDLPIFNELIDTKTPLPIKKEVLVMLLSFVVSIPENRSLYLKAGFLSHALLCLSSTSRRQSDDQFQEFCLLILSHVLGSIIFLTSSWNSIEESRQADEVCRKVCEILSIAVSLEVQHAALICLQKFSCLRPYHSLIYESKSRDQLFVLCLKGTACNIESSRIPLYFHISELACQILTNLYLGDYAADIRERRVDIAEADRFVPRSVVEIFDMLFSRLIWEADSHHSSFVSRLDSLVETSLKFCAVLAVDSSNHPKFWDANKPLAVTIAKNMSNFPHQSHLHIANMLKYVSSSIDNESSRNYWSHLDDLDFQICCFTVIQSMNDLISPRAVLANRSDSASSSSGANSEAAANSNDSSSSDCSLSACDIPLSNVAVEEATFCALMQFCRMDDFVEQFAVLCNSCRIVDSWIYAARLSSVLAMGLFLSAAINIVILDQNCTITPKFLKAGLLSLPVFHTDLRVVNQDSSLYFKVAKCIFRTLTKNNDMIMDLFLESECIETLVLFISNMTLSVEDVRSQNAAKTICSCFKVLCKNPTALIRLVTFGTGGCVPLLIEFFIPNAIYETRVECFQAIVEILTECRAIIEIDAVLLDKESQYLCFSESILGIVLSFLSKQEVSRSASQKQEAYVFECLGNLCALSSSNHESLLRLILENSMHRAHFYESICKSQVDDPSRIPSLHLIAELVKMGNDISTIQAMRPDILKFTIDIFEHVSFQRSIVAQLLRIDLTSELALLFVRLIHLFTSTEGISHSVRRIYWPAIRAILDTAQSQIVAITKRMRKNACLMNITSKSLAEQEEILLINEERLVLTCTYALRNMCVQMSRSPHAHESGKDAFSVVALLFQEPSPCRLPALQVVSILASQFGHDSDFLRAIAKVPDMKNSVLGKGCEVFCDECLLFDERLMCIKFLTKFGANRETSSVIYDLLIDSKAAKGNFESLMPSLAPNFNPEYILDSLSIIHWAIIHKIEQGALLDVKDAFCNSNLVHTLVQLILPFDAAIGLKALEVLSDIMDPQPFEFHFEHISSSEKLVHLWPHFVSVVSIHAKSSSERLIKAVSKILVSRISMRDANCLTHKSLPYWSLNVSEILAVVQSLNSNFNCVEQECIAIWSLRRFVTTSEYKTINESSLPICFMEKADDSSISSICVEEIISFLIGTISMDVESSRYSRSGSSVLHNYITEHAAFVLMHISCHLRCTGQLFPRSIVLILVNVFLSCKDSPQVTNFECYILACLHDVVLSSDQMVLASDFERIAFWDRIVNRIILFANVPNGNANELLLLIPGFSCSRIVLGLFDGLSGCLNCNPQFVQLNVRIPFAEISKYMTSSDVAERQHAISILCNLARMSNSIPDIISTFWKDPSASSFVQSVQEILESGDTVTEREYACGFIYFSSKHPRERCECWHETFQCMCQIIFGPNRFYETITRCLFCSHHAISITSLHCLINFSSSFLYPTFPHSHLMMNSFQQDFALFKCLSVMNHQPSSHIVAPVLKEEFKLGGEHEIFVRYFAQKTLQFFFNTSSVSELLHCFICEDIIMFVVKSLQKTTEIFPNGDNALYLELIMLAVNIILNLCKFGDVGTLSLMVNSGITALLIDLLKDKTIPADLISQCLNALSQVAHIEDAKAFIKKDHEFMCRISSFLLVIGDTQQFCNTLYLLVLLRKITLVLEIRDFLLSESNEVDVFQSCLEVYEGDNEEHKVEALGVLSNLVLNDRIRALLPNTNFLALNAVVIRNPTNEEHLKFSLIAFVNICCDCSSNLELVAGLPGLIEEICKCYLDPMASDAIKYIVSKLLIFLSSSSVTLSISGGLYPKYLSAAPEAFIHLLCRIVCFQASIDGTTLLATLQLLYTTSMKTTNVSYLAKYMIEECRNQSDDAQRLHSIFENLVSFMDSDISDNREIAVQMFAGVAKVNDWVNFFAVYRSHILVAGSTSLDLSFDSTVSPNPIVPLLLQSASQSQFSKEASEAISALASLSDHEDFLCQISAHEPAFGILVNILTSSNHEASIKSSQIFCNLGTCSKTQPDLCRNQSIILSLAESFPQKVTIDDLRLRNIMSCFHHLSKIKDLDQLSCLCQTPVLLPLVRLFGGNHSLQISEILLHICGAFSLHPDFLDRVVCAGTIMSLITNMQSMNLEPKILQNCFAILIILKSIPGVMSQLFHHVNFIEMVCRSMYSTVFVLESATLLLELSACQEHRHRLFRCIKFITDACKYLLRSNMKKLDGVPAFNAEETCIGASVLSNIAAEFCHLEDFSSFFNYFPEHMWYQQNFMASPDTQAPNARVQECCTRAIFALCEGEGECFQINQVACANACFTQLYGLLENGATNAVKINSARSLCAITALSQNTEIRTLLANKISPSQLWHVPLLIIRQRDPEDAVEFCMGLICHLVEDARRGAELAMVPVEKLGGAIRHIEWTLFKSLNHENVAERLYAMRIMAAICVEQLSDRAMAADSLTGDVSRRIMKCNVGIGVFYQLMGQFKASSHEQEKERICMIFDRFSSSSEFESQLRVHDPECSFFSDCVKSENHVVCTLGCSIIKNACKFVSSLSAIATNDELLSAICLHIESDNNCSNYVLHTLVQLACVGNFRHISIFDNVKVLGSLVRLLGSNNREFKNLSCRLLLAVSDSNDFGPRCSIIIGACPLPHLVSIIKDTPLVDSKVPLLLMSKLSSFPETQAFLHRDLLFVREIAMKVSHGKGADLSSEKSQIALAALSCIAKLTRDFSLQNVTASPAVVSRIQGPNQPLIPVSTSLVADFFACSQIMSSARECIDITIDSATHDSHKFAFINFAMEIFYNMSKLESSHQEMQDPRHQLLSMWCRFFNHIPSPGAALQRSLPVLHLQYALLILCNLMQSRTCPLEPFTVFSVASSLPKQLEVILKRYCLAVDEPMGSIPPLKCLTLSAIQLFVQDRQTRKLFIESEKVEATTFVIFFCQYLSRKRSNLPNIDNVIESILNILFTLTSCSEYLPVLIKYISCSGRDVLLEYMRYASQASTRILILKSLLNISRCSDKDSLATLSEAEGTKHLTEWLLNHMFKKPNASTVEEHLSLSTLFNLRHLIKIDPSTRGFLLHPKESEYRDKVILASRAPHCDPIGASLRLICLKFLSFLLHLCECENNIKCYDNISFKLFADKKGQASSGFRTQPLLEIATLPDIHTLSSDVETDFDSSQLDFLVQIAQFHGDYALSDIESPFMEGTAERISQIEKAISQHACSVMCTVLCSIQATLVEQLILSERGSKLYVPIVSHIREGSCFPLIVQGCKSFACLSKNTSFIESFSDPVIISTLLTLLDQLAASTAPQSVIDDIMTAILGFSTNFKCIPFGLIGEDWDQRAISLGGISRHHATVKTRRYRTGGVWMVAVLSRWFSGCRQEQHKKMTLSIIEHLTHACASTSHQASENDFDALLVAVAENLHFGLAFICAQLDSSSESPFTNCLSILFNILASCNVRQLVTAPASFYNCTDMLCRLIYSNESKSKLALSCLTFLCQDCDLACGLIPFELIQLVMERILKTMGNSKADFHHSNVDALKLLQCVFRNRLRVVQMFEVMPQFFENIILFAHSDQDELRQHTSRLILSVCCAEEPAVFEIFMKKDICTLVSSLRDSQSEQCADIATQIACKLLSCSSFELQVEQRVRLFCALQCGIFSRFDCNWPTQQAPTSLKCAIEGNDVDNAVHFSCVALPGGHYNIQSTKELILVHHNSFLGSVYCVITVSLHPTMHIILLRYRDAISHFFSSSRTSIASVDLQISMQSFVNCVVEISHSMHIGVNFFCVAITPERLLWSSISSIPGIAHHRLFLPSGARCIESNFETAIGSARLYLLDRPSNRSCFVIGSEGFCRSMSDSQVADAINVLALDSPFAQTALSLRMSGELLSLAKDLVNISTLGRVNGVGADDGKIPECSCILLHLDGR